MGNISRRDPLDDELAEVAGLADPKEAPDGAMALPAADSRGSGRAGEAKRTNYGLLGALLVIATGLVALFMFGFKDASVYSIAVDKLLAEGTVGRRVRIDGELVPGTLSRRDKPCEFRFKVRANGKQLDIHYPQCVIPDTFRDVPEGGVMVTAEGKLTEAGHFDASLILAKCSSKYDPKTHSMSEKKPGAVDAM